MLVCLTTVSDIMDLIPCKFGFISRLSNAGSGHEFCLQLCVYSVCQHSIN